MDKAEINRNLFRLIFLLLTGFLIYPVQSRAAEVPVLLRLTSAAQTDTTGCNFVKELSSLVYREVMKGKVKLWDSREKELQISPASLQAICESSEVTMGADSGQLIYVYEYWEEQREEIRSRTIGFLFSAKNTVGREISFGYVDFSDIETATLQYKINTNVNGDYGATAATYISSKNYNFSLLQFNGQVISGIEESNALLQAYRKGRYFNIQRGNVQPVQLKFIRQELTTGNDDISGEAALSRQFIAKLDSFYHAEIEFLFNNSPDSVHDMLQTKNWKLTGLQISELWRKDQSGITVSLVDMTLFVNGKLFAVLPYRVLVEQEFVFYNQPFINWLTGHTYASRILSVNSQQTGRAEAVLYRKALKNAEWNRLSDYVRYY